MKAIAANAILKTGISFFLLSALDSDISLLSESSSISFSSVCNASFSLESPENRLCLFSLGFFIFFSESESCFSAASSGSSLDPILPAGIKFPLSSK